MNINNAKYELTAVKENQYPQNNIPEIAFVGRSNVGKSSVINTLLNRKNLARVGSTPGKTRKINFYNIDDRMYFVDLPGYGYAKVSKNEKTTWGKMIETYLHTRKHLKLIIMIVDVRHTPTDNDIIMYDWIQSCELPLIVVATKSDKISKSKANTNIGNIKPTLNCHAKVPIIAFSSVTRQGKEKVWDEIKKNIF